jgi:RNA polymerase sigma-70 factor (ECF subfamily)
MDTDQLLDRIVLGDASATEALLTRHHKRLRRMVYLRIDPRLAARLDPSDIVQDALAEAHKRLPDYAAQRPIPFYPWLRRIAWDRLLAMHRRHIAAKRRTVLREDVLPLSEDSEMLLAERLAATEASSPSHQLLRREIRDRVRQAIAQLPAGDREIITLKHLEDLSFQEAAAVLEVTAAAVYSRYYRAIQRLHRLLHESEPS